MAYDHGKKAGNEGDVVKHVALWATIDSVIAAAAPKTTFRFADLYAGYASHVLRRDGEWKKGIALLRQNFTAAGITNVHLATWVDRWLRSTVSDGDAYPGSVLVAREAIRGRKRSPRLAAWDIEPSPIANLVATLGSGGPPGAEASVFTWKADPREQDVQQADLIFLDPPKIDRACFKVVREVKSPSVLIWFPLNTSSGTESGASKRAHRDGIGLGLKSTKVVWAPPATAKGRAKCTGCELLYRLPDPATQALRDAVEAVVRVMGWTATLQTDVCLGTPPAQTATKFTAFQHAP